MRARKFLSAALLTTLLFPSIQPLQAENKIRKKPVKRILIIHSDGLLAYSNANDLSSYLRHFKATVKIVEQTNYEKNSLSRYDNVFYIGTQDDRLKNDLVKDISKTKKPVAWLYRNISQIVNSSTSQKFGFKLNGFVQDIDHTSYKDTRLLNFESQLAKIKVLNQSKVKTFAKFFLKNKKDYPYIIKRKNFTYVAGNPFEDAREGSSILGFVDYLHEIVEKHKVEQKAIVRLEDVHPASNIPKLRMMIDYLYLNNIPFAMGIIPAYRKSAKSELILAHQRPEFVKLLKYAKKKGAVFVLHGYSHQYKGRTGEDAEFWNLKKGAPIDNSAAYTKKRIQLALTEMKRIGIKPTIWETPHYQASKSDRKIIAQYFDKTFERQGSQGQLLVPFYLPKNEYGQKVIPETLGYPSFPKKIRTPNLIIRNAQRVKVVRDGYAVFFIHYFAPFDYLENIIGGLKSQGYKFVSPNQVIGEKFIKPKPAFFMDRQAFYFAYSINNALENVSYWAIIGFLFIAYYLVIFGLSFIGRSRKKILANTTEKFFVFVVPALNEEIVIEKTIRSLLAVKGRNYLVLAVNDSSTDGTLKIIKSIRSSRLRIISTKSHNARKGKGNVLNLAYKYVDKLQVIKKYGRRNVILSIVDSDGRVDPFITKSVEPFFDDLKTGAVQTPVRIINHNQNIWTRWQDYEFRVFSFMFQSARELIGSVGLGGNGQFVRLSALDSIAPNPWSNCLTEDLEIGIRLLLAGWRNRYCANTYVSQQAVVSFWPLVKQRTRWFQGHLTCWKHLPAIAESDLKFTTKLDVAYYLLAVLLAFFVIPANFVAVTLGGYVLINFQLLSFLVSAYGIKTFLLAYMIYFGALPIFIYSYWRAKKQSLIKAIILSHLYLLVSVVWLIAAYFALFRIGSRSSKWSKTPRWETT